VFDGAPSHLDSVGATNARRKESNEPP